MKATRSRASTVFGRYLLMQLPGFFVAAALLALLVQHDQISSDLAAGLFAAWVAFEIALFPVFRIGYEPGNALTGAEAIVGSVGIAKDDLDPGGTVLLGAERWRAEVRGGRAFVAAGTAVRVREVRQLTLVVEPLDAGDVNPRNGRPRA